MFLFKFEYSIVSFTPKIVYMMEATYLRCKTDNMNHFINNCQLFYFHTFNSSYGSRHNLVEDVVGSFKCLLGNDTSFFKQICKVINSITKGNHTLVVRLTSFNISTSQFTSGTEVNTDEFTLNKKKEK